MGMKPYTVKFNELDAPAIYSAFSKYLKNVKASQNLKNTIEIINYMEKDLNIKFKILDAPPKLVYVAKFFNEKDFAWFLLRWS
jgi:hypothetical protein